MRVERVMGRREKEERKELGEWYREGLGEERRERTKVDEEKIDEEM